MYSEKEPLKDKRQTAERIAKLVNRFFDDLDKVYTEHKGKKVQVSKLDFKDYFDLVRKIPYRRDTTKYEVVARPYYVLKHGRLGMDCKKKAIAIASYLKYHCIPYRFIGSSQRKDKKVHHIFVQMMYEGQWKNVDATYPEYRIFQPKILTYSEVLA